VEDQEGYRSSYSVKTNYSLPFVLQQLAGDGLLFLVAPDRHVLLQVLPLLLVPQGQHLLLFRALLLRLQLALKTGRQALQFLFPLILREWQTF
jgi:hypothetical protein